jgi:glycosyltransferase involved in cell wall biosynthesis
LIRQLAREHEITLIALTKTIPIEDARLNIPQLRQFCRSVEVVPARPFDPGNIGTYKGFISPLPRSIVETFSPEMERLVDAKVKTEEYDVVVASEVSSPSIVSLLATRVEGIPIVLDALEVTVAKDAYHRQTSLRRRIRNGLIWYKLRYFTRELLRRANVCTVPSMQEKHNLLELMPEHPRIEVIPHCLDLRRYSDSFGTPEPDSLVFTGSFTYHANLDAAYYFIEQIYPLVKVNLPTAQLKIVGSTDGVNLNEWPIDKSILFTGLLQDVRSTVARSWLSVVPLRIGAGTRLKIIESMALGTPVVSTAKGAEGLDVVHGKNIMIADEPDEIASSVVRILRDSKLRERLSTEGRNLILEKYSSEVMGRKFNSLLDFVVTAYGSK